MPERDRRVATYETIILSHFRFEQTYKPILDVLLLAPFDLRLCAACAVEMTPVRSGSKRSLPWSAAALGASHSPH